MPADFARGDDWAAKLVEAGYDAAVPTVWLLEGLVYYLRDPDVGTLLSKIGGLSAPGSAVFHDSITKRPAASLERPLDARRGRRVSAFAQRGPPRRASMEPRRAYVSAGIVPGGAPFVSGSDDYGSLWREAGFENTLVHWRRQKDSSTLRDA